MSGYKIADLFAGIGGTRLGFDRAFGDDAETVSALRDSRARRFRWRASATALKTIYRGVCRGTLFMDVVRLCEPAS